MKFQVFQCKKTQVFLGEDGIFVPNLKCLVPNKHVFFYTYREENKCIYHLVFQYASFEFTNFIFNKSNDLVEALQQNNGISKKVFNVKINEFDLETGHILLEDKSSISWGPVLDTGAYSVNFSVSYRKEPLIQYVDLHQIRANTNYILTEEKEINTTSLQKTDPETQKFGIWDNNPIYWQKFYKAKKFKDKKIGCFYVGVIVIIILTLFVFLVSLLP